MAGHGSSYSFDNHPESSGYSNDDFEKLDAPGSGFDHNGDHDGPNAAGSGAYDYDQNQDEEVTTTTTDNAGEDEDEDYLYGVRASEAEAYAHSTEPLISLEDDDALQSRSVEPSAPVPDIEPLIDFNNSTAADIFPSLEPSAPLSSSHFPQSIPTTSNPLLDFDDFQPESKEPQGSEEAAEGNTSWVSDCVSLKFFCLKKFDTLYINEN